MLKEKPLRFAPLIRVSTEKQKKKGEFLAVQRKQLEQSIKSLGGIIPNDKWYAGQEHATPDQERKILDQLMEDAKTHKFDAVIVDDRSRWSRDNERSKSDLRILKANGIRFFVGTEELDLHDPTTLLLLGISTEIGEWQAKEQARKSRLSRIARAKRNIPTAGKKPYGRTYNKLTNKWGLIDGAKEKIETIAREYLEDDVNFKTLGKKYGMNASNLHKILTKRCGDKWPERFKSLIPNKDKPYEENIHTIPRLLDEETIKRIQEKSEGRRTWTHGEQKYHYLFARKIFDVGTTYTLTGTTNAKGVRYYRPYKGKGYQYSINADVLENAIMGELFEALSNKRKLREAIFDGNPLTDVVEKIKSKMVQKEKELKSTNAKLSNITHTIENYKREDLDSYLESLKPEIKLLSDRKRIVESEIQSCKTQLDSLPTEQEIEGTSKRSKDLLKRIKESYFSSEQSFQDLPYEGKKKLVDLIFGGKDVMNKKYGIYIRSLGGKPKRYKFEVYGKLGIMSGRLEARSKKIGVHPDLVMSGQEMKVELKEGISKLMIEKKEESTSASY